MVKYRPVQLCFAPCLLVVMSAALLWAERRCWLMLAVQTLWLAPEPRSVMKMNAADESRETLRGFYK